MEENIYSAVLNINFDDFEDFDDADNLDSLGIVKVPDASRNRILKNVYLNLLMTVGPKVKTVFTNLELVNTEVMHEFYNEVIEKMEYDTKRKDRENLIYDFLTVCKGEFTEVNIGFSAKGVYISTVSTKKCLEQDLVSNYIEKNFLTVFLNETAKDVIRYSAISRVAVKDVKNLFMYATILSLKNGTYPIAFTPLNRYTKEGDDEELVKTKVRRIYSTLMDNFGE